MCKRHYDEVISAGEPIEVAAVGVRVREDFQLARGAQMEQDQNEDEAAGESVDLGGSGFNPSDDPVASLFDDIHGAVPVPLTTNVTDQPFHLSGSRQRLSLIHI